MPLALIPVRIDRMAAMLGRLLNSPLQPFPFVVAEPKCLTHACPSCWPHISTTSHFHTQRVNLPTSALAVNGQLGGEVSSNQITILAERDQISPSGRCSTPGRSSHGNDSFFVWPISGACTSNCSFQSRADPSTSLGVSDSSHRFHGELSVAHLTPASVLNTMFGTELLRERLLLSNCCCSFR